MTERRSYQTVYMDTDNHRPDGISAIDADGRFVMAVVSRGTKVTITHQEPVTYYNQSGQEVGVLAVTGELEDLQTITNAEVTFCDPANPEVPYTEPRKNHWYVLYEGDVMTTVSENVLQNGS